MTRSQINMPNRSFLMRQILRVLFFASAIILFSPSGAFAAGQCQCPCAGAAGAMTTGGTCTSIDATGCSRAQCVTVCGASAATLTVGERFACVGPALAPTPTPAPTTERKYCSFQCVTGTNPQGTPINLTNVSVSCTADTECGTACDARCPIPGNAGTTGNGLSAAEGTGLVCYRNSASNPPIVPKCLLSGQSSNPRSVTATTPAAQTRNTAATLPNPVGTTDMVALLGRVFKAFFGIIGALALMWMTWGGILWMTAEESKRTEDAKVIMKNAALGIVLLFFSYGLAASFLGIFNEVARQARPTTSNTRNSTTR